MGKSADSWRQRAEYDLETARAMLDAGRSLYVLFCCQHAIEKALKALIVERTGELPPRIHNLPRLADAAGLELNGEGRICTPPCLLSTSKRGILRRSVRLARRSPGRGRRPRWRKPRSRFDGCSQC
ncbi:MAG: HEPN domain-containing protein [Verrucomicrobia bacterium]|nr:HEPN domain-containing protein [Verrucomicrobiota bacterium]